jgi:hypothetical protein
MTPPASVCVERPRERFDVDAQGWGYFSSLDFGEVERLLDWLEANDFTRREVSVGPEKTVTVRWHR